MGCFDCQGYALSFSDCKTMTLVIESSKGWLALLFATTPLLIEVGAPEFNFSNT